MFGSFEKMMQEEGEKEVKSQWPWMLGSSRRFLAGSGDIASTCNGVFAAFSLGNAFVYVVQISDGLKVKHTVRFDCDVKALYLCNGEVLRLYVVTSDMKCFDVSLEQRGLLHVSGESAFHSFEGTFDKVWVVQWVADAVLFICSNQDQSPMTKFYIKRLGDSLELAFELAVHRVSACASVDLTREAKKSFPVQCVSSFCVIIGDDEGRLLYRGSEEEHWLVLNGMDGKIQSILATDENIIAIDVLGTVRVFSGDERGFDLKCSVSSFGIGLIGEQLLLFDDGQMSCIRIQRDEKRIRLQVPHVDVKAVIAADDRLIVCTGYGMVYLYQPTENHCMYNNRCNIDKAIQDLAGTEKQLERAKIYSLHLDRIGRFLQHCQQSDSVTLRHQICMDNTAFSVNCAIQFNFSVDILEGCQLLIFCDAANTCHVFQKGAQAQNLFSLRLKTPQTFTITVFLCRLEDSAPSRNFGSTPRLWPILQRQFGIQDFASREGEFDFGPVESMIARLQRKHPHLHSIYDADTVSNLKMSQKQWTIKGMRSSVDSLRRIFSPFTNGQLPSSFEWTGLVRMSFKSQIFQKEHSNNINFQCPGALVLSIVRASIVQALREVHISDANEWKHFASDMKSIGDHSRALLLQLDDLEEDMRALESLTLSSDPLVLKAKLKKVIDQLIEAHHILRETVVSALPLF